MYGIEVAYIILIAFIIKLKFTYSFLHLLSLSFPLLARRNVLEPASCWTSFVAD